ncbi:hypothetical protein DFH06DRAFT_1131090 [Mycena polygramma]|nr:hypothetical protein DFH06DRAFT_1131090 [Mycena polygramma]
MRTFHTRLGWGHNWTLWAPIARCKHVIRRPAAPNPAAADGFDLDGFKGKKMTATQTRTPYRARTRVRGWIGRSLMSRMKRASVVGGSSRDVGDGDEWRTRGKGKNRRQLLRADAREFAMCYVRERLEISHESPPNGTPPACARRRGPGGRAVGALCFLRELSAVGVRPRTWGAFHRNRGRRPPPREGGHSFLSSRRLKTHAAESEPLRRHIMSLLLPLVVAPVRTGTTIGDARAIGKGCRRGVAEIGRGSQLRLLPFAAQPSISFGALFVYALCETDAVDAQHGAAGIFVRRRSIYRLEDALRWICFFLCSALNPIASRRCLVRDGRRGRAGASAERNASQTGGAHARVYLGVARATILCPCPLSSPRPHLARIWDTGRSRFRRITAHFPYMRWVCRLHGRRYRDLHLEIHKGQLRVFLAIHHRRQERAEAHQPDRLAVRGLDAVEATAGAGAATAALVEAIAKHDTGARMGVPPHLPRDRAEAAVRWAADGGIGPRPIRPTQEDIYEKNARPLVRFEHQLPTLGSSLPSSSASTLTSSTSASASTNAAPGTASTSTAGPTSIATPAASPTAANAAIDAILAVDPGLDATIEDDGRDDRWATHRWRARLCTGRESSRSGGTGWWWSGTMLMPSEPPYTALVATPRGAFPPGGLARDDFVAAARPVFHPDPTAPPPAPDSTTADEGMYNGWLPPGTRVDAVGGGCVEVRVPAAAAEWRRGDEERYIYHTVLDARAPPGAHAAHETDTCPGCVRRRERARWARVGGDDGGEGEMWEEGSYQSPSSEAAPTPHHRTPPSPHLLRNARQSSPSSKSQHSDSSSWAEWDAPAWAAHRFDDDEGWEGICDGVQDVIFTGELWGYGARRMCLQCPSSPCGGALAVLVISDEILYLEVEDALSFPWPSLFPNPRHGMAWHHYEYAGRVRPWYGLIGLVMRPRDRTLGLATYFISGHLAGRDTFQGTWQMAGQGVLAPSLGGSLCLARGED